MLLSALRARALSLSAFAAMAAFGALLTVGCSSSSTDDGAGASGAAGNASGDEASTAPRVILSARLVPSAGGACQQAGKALTVGAFEPPTSVLDGDTERGGAVLISCRIAPEGAAFDIASQIEVEGASGGSFRLTGRADESGASRAASLAFALTDGETFNAETCVLDPAVRTPASGVAPGRYWAGFKCPGDASTGALAGCSVEGEIRVENCAPR